MAAVPRTEKVWGNTEGSGTTPSPAIVLLLHLSNPPVANSSPSLTKIAPVPPTMPTGTSQTALAGALAVQTLKGDGSANNLGGPGIGAPVTPTPPLAALGLP